MNHRGWLAALLLAAQLYIQAGPAGAEPHLSRGQTLYVPVYSHVYTGDRALPFNLAATLSIRNVDSANIITITQITYHDSHGRMVKKYLAGPHSLPPQGSTSYFLKEKDSSGGFGAHFIVRWEAEREVNAPVVESVMIGARSGQGISFVSPAREIVPTGGK